ncbi:MAG: GldG family protein [Desulfomonile tiedjei]|nr:GldG family protein [Desulfomonile tiedjei]
MEGEYSKRKLVLGAGTLIGAIIFLAIIVAVQYITLQHPERWDLTQGGRYTLSPQSKKILETFKEKKIPIEVIGFYDIKNLKARAAAQELLDQYRDVDSSFVYTFADPDQDRALALANKVESYPTLVIKAAGQDTRITTLDEENLTNGLVKLLRTEVKKIYFLKGHGEHATDSAEPVGFKIAKEQIEKQNYKTADLVLMQSPSVPEDAAILVIGGPKTDPMDAEFEMIRGYLDRGGSVLVLLNPFQTPKLCEFLKDYGFETAEDIVVDRMSRAVGGDYLMPIITTYIDFPITKNFELASFFPEARSVRVPEKLAPGLEGQELALTSQDSWTISKEQLDLRTANFDEKTGKKGPIPVMGVVSHFDPEAAMKSPKKGDESAKKEPTAEQQDEKAEGQDPDTTIKKGRLVVAGSSLFAANKYFKLQGNGDLFMNTVSWLAEDENLIAIRPKSLHAQPIVLTPSESLFTLLIPMGLVPLAWIIAGVLVFLYRRRSIAA